MVAFRRHRVSQASAVDGDDAGFGNGVFEKNSGHAECDSRFVLERPEHGMMELIPIMACLARSLEMALSPTSWWYNCGTNQWSVTQPAAQGLAGLSSGLVPASVPPRSHGSHRKAAHARRAPCESEGSDEARSYRTYPVAGGAEVFEGEPFIAAGRGAGQQWPICQRPVAKPIESFAGVNPFALLASGGAGGSSDGGGGGGAVPFAFTWSSPVRGREKRDLANVGLFKAPLGGGASGSTLAYTSAGAKRDEAVVAPLSALLHGSRRSHMSQGTGVMRKTVSVSGGLELGASFEATRVACKAPDTSAGVKRGKAVIAPLSCGGDAAVYGAKRDAAKLELLKLGLTAVGDVDDEVDHLPGPCSASVGQTASGVAGVPSDAISSCSASVVQTALGVAGVPSVAISSLPDVGICRGSAGKGVVGVVQNPHGIIQRLADDAVTPLGEALTCAAGRDKVSINPKVVFVDGRARMECASSPTRPLDLTASRDSENLVADSLHYVGDAGAGADAAGGGLGGTDLGAGPENPCDVATAYDESDVLLASAYGFASVGLWRADVAAQNARDESHNAEMMVTIAQHKFEKMFDAWSQQISGDAG
jgi:hypothetical protein